MKVQDVMRGYDYDLPLMDALSDPELSVDRRVLAGATVGIGLDTAYLSVCQLEEAFSALASDHANGVEQGRGYEDLADILKDQSPYQMRVWHLLDTTPLQLALEDLAWLKSLTYRRARMARVVREEKLMLRYVTDEALCEGVTASQLMARVSAVD
ncbi:hypothetical protein [Sphingomonas sp. BK069]|uniref:hypothetical protein n=1 Tax=Sphingomonas sp. BK069 TaxID=2586979 RepID=UPI0016086C7D|nr:hypothetical protein [Sphingomonas sp. BK069]MBB3349427.1 hypothetical protein [Sphingomonas sp. BK069]